MYTYKVSLCTYIYVHIYIYIYIYICNCLCGSVDKASDTQAVGHGFDPHPDHYLFYKMGLNILFRSDLI